MLSSMGQWDFGPDHGWARESPGLDCRCDWWAHQIAKSPTSMDPADAAKQIHHLYHRRPCQHLHPAAAAARIIQCSFYHHSQASPDVEKPFYGICTKECTVSRRNGSWSMGWSKAAAAPIGIDGVKAAAPSEWKSAIRPAYWLQTLARRAQVLLLFSMSPMTQSPRRRSVIMTWSYRVDGVVYGAVLPYGSRQKGESNCQTSSIPRHPAPLVHIPKWTTHLFQPNTLFWGCCLDRACKNGAYRKSCNEKGFSKRLAFSLQSFLSKCNSGDLWVLLRANISHFWITFNKNPLIYRVLLK